MKKFRTAPPAGDTFELTEKMLEKEDTENPDQPIGRKYRQDRIPLSNSLKELRSIPTTSPATFCLKISAAMSITKCRL